MIERSIRADLSLCLTVKEVSRCRRCFVALEKKKVMTCQPVVIL